MPCLLANQQNHTAVLMAQFNQNQGPRAATMALIPTFSGRATDSLADWEEALSRAAVSDQWNDEMKRRAAVTKLDGAALAWHDHTGYALVEWNDWIAGIRALFQPRLSLTEWCLLVERRTQLAGESGVEYSMEKVKLFRLCPHQLQEQEKVDYLIWGLMKPDQRGALLGNPPADVATFIEALRSIEQRTSMFSTPVTANHFSPTQLLHTITSLAESVKRLEASMQTATQQPDQAYSRTHWSRPDTPINAIYDQGNEEASSVGQDWQIHH